jgi:hypothetical protein
MDDVGDAVRRDGMPGGIREQRSHGRRRHRDANDGRRPSRHRACAFTEREALGNDRRRCRVEGRRSDNGRRRRSRKDGTGRDARDRRGLDPSRRRGGDHGGDGGRRPGGRGPGGHSGRHGISRSGRGIGRRGHRSDRGRRGIRRLGHRSDRGRRWISRRLLGLRLHGLRLHRLRVRGPGRGGRGGLHRRRRDDNSRGRRHDRRQQRQRVEIAVVVGGRADPEMDVRHVELRRAARADGADRRPLVDLRALRDRDRAEVRQRHGQRVARQDRHCPAARRDRAGERHGPGDRRRDVGSGRGADVDAAVLPARVRMRRIEGERREHGALDRPRPRPGTWHAEQEEQADDGETAHTRLLLLSDRKTGRAQSSGGVGCCQF